MAGNDRSREPSHLWEAGAQCRTCLHPPSPTRRTRPLHHRQVDLPPEGTVEPCKAAVLLRPSQQCSPELRAHKWWTRLESNRRSRPLHHSSDKAEFLHLQNGEQARPESPRSPFGPCGRCSIQLSYRCFHLAGLEPATTSLSAKKQTSSPPFCKRDVGEQSRRKRHPETQGQPFGKARSPRRDTHCGGRLHGTDRMPGSPRPLSWRSGCLREVSDSSPPTFGFQGNARRGLCLASEGIRAFTTWNFKISSASSFRCCGGAGNKNPSGAWAREGFGNRTADGRYAILPPRERVQTQPRANHAPVVCFRLSIMLGMSRSRFSRATIVRNGGGV